MATHKFDEVEGDEERDTSAYILTAKQLCHIIFSVSKINTLRMQIWLLNILTENSCV